MVGSSRLNTYIIVILGGLVRPRWQSQTNASLHAASSGFWLGQGGGLERTPMLFVRGSRGSRMRGLAGTRSCTPTVSLCLSLQRMGSVAGRVCRTELGGGGWGGVAAAAAASFDPLVTTNASACSSCSSLCLSPRIPMGSSSGVCAVSRMGGGSGRRCSPSSASFTTRLTWVRGGGSGGGGGGGLHSPGTVSFGRSLMVVVPASVDPCELGSSLCSSYGTIEVPVGGVHSPTVVSTFLDSCPCFQLLLG